MTEVERITEQNVISFPKLGFEFSIDPTAFTVFGLGIQWYGIIIVLGIALASLYCFPRMKRFGIAGSDAMDAVLGGIIGGIIGARAYFVIFNWDSYKDNLVQIFNTRNGGLAIYGGLIGAMIVGLTICRIKKIRLLPMLDIAVIGFLIGQGVGRWGNFVNQEAFGTNTDSIFGMTGGRIQSYILRNSAYMDGDAVSRGIELSEKYAVHPCFLYESVWCLLGFVILAFWSKRRRYDGQLFLMYLSWYGFERMIVEGLRTDSLMFGNLRVSQGLSAIVLVVSVIIQIIQASRFRREPERFILYAETQESKKYLESIRLREMNRKLGVSHEKNAEDDIITEKKEESDKNEAGYSGIIKEENENGTDN